MKVWAPLATVLAGIALFAAGQTLPQQPPAQALQSDQPTRIQVDVTRVSLLFTVTDRKGRFVTNLAKDDFEVASVLVEIRDPAGAVLEKGAAALSSKGSEDWVYTTTVAVPAALTAVVIAVAIADRPGNKDVAQVDHLLRRAT